MLLQNKNAVIYGAGGSLGGALARLLAKEGATVFCSGHKIMKAGGSKNVNLKSVRLCSVHNPSRLKR